MDKSPFKRYLQPRNTVADLEEEVTYYRSLSNDEHGRLIIEACNLARAQALSHPDPQEVLAYQDPIPPDSESLWISLVKKEKNKPHA